MEAMFIFPLFPLHLASFVYFQAIFAVNLMLKEKGELVVLNASGRSLTIFQTNLALEVG